MKKCEYNLSIQCSELDCSSDCIKKAIAIKEVIEKHEEILKLGGSK